MYTLSDFTTIHKQNKYVLPTDVMERIQMLCTSIGATPKFSVMVQKRGTLQDAMREINKLTQENKSTQIPLLLEIIENIHIASFMDLFFTILCKNSFFSSVYAELYQQLHHKYDIISFWDVKYASYVETLKNIQIVGPENYDEYCKIHALHDEMRTFTLFLVQLTNLGIIPRHYYETVVSVVFQQIDIFMHSNKEIMNELVELMVILNPKDEKIKHLSSLNPANYAGINHKIIFRFMDILNH